MKLEITEDRGGYVIGRLDGHPVELHQSIATKAGECRGCHKRYSKQQLVFSLADTPPKASYLWRWCFPCTRPVEATPP